ncbi:hypothetical protein SO802_025339 [Lithocarpus litseifolius]|uniref:DUF4408 domain-containing protein n=1 Tax=Lithocarpus litseifolius TaxID=425828 RepID=A0AAW2BWJ1_9ROSI
MLRIKNLFRYVEICLAVVLFSWTFTRLPFAVRLSVEYFRQLSAFASSPLFVFILCNVIIVTLIVKSGCFSAQKPVADNAETEIYEELIKHGGDSAEPPLETDPSVVTEPLALVVYQDKQIVFEEKKSTISGEAEMGSDSKVCRRTQSEKFERESSKKPRQKLRRSETEKYMKVAQSDEKFTEKEYPKLSDEEFQRTIDAFIAKQSKFHRQESLAIVVSNHS